MLQFHSWAMIQCICLKTTQHYNCPTNKYHNNAIHPTEETKALQRKEILANRFASLSSSVNQLTLITDWKVYLITYQLWFKNMRMNIWSRRGNFWRKYYPSVKWMYWKCFVLFLRELISLGKKDRPMQVKIASNLLVWTFTWYGAKYWFSGYSFLLCL